MYYQRQKMTIRPDIAEFVANLEAFCKGKLNYPSEVGELLQIVVQTGLISEFEELIFQAKFLVRTQVVMKKNGREAEGFEKLSTEFQSGIKKSIDLLKILIVRAPTDVAKKYSDVFLAMETESFAYLMKLYSDLSWIKNWQIDGKPLPYETKPSKTIINQEQTSWQIKENQQNKQSTKSLYRIQKSALLGVILFIIFLLIDPPATILGWILSLWIAVMLAYIIIQTIILIRSINSC